MKNDFLYWLTVGQDILIVSKDQTFRGFFKTVCGDFIVLDTSNGDMHFIREDLIESVTAYCKAGSTSMPLSEAKCTPHTDDEAIADELAIPWDGDDKMEAWDLREGGSTDVLSTELVGEIDKSKSYIFKPGDRVPLSDIDTEKSYVKPRTIRPYRGEPTKYPPKNSVEQPTLCEILDDLESKEDVATIPPEDLQVVHASGTIKMRENLKKYGFIEGFDENKTNYWFPFNALTDDDLGVPDDVIFLKGVNDKGYTASGIAAPGTIHRLLLLADHILKTRYYNFPIVLPLLEAMLEQYPNNLSIQSKYQEVKERQESYGKRKQSFD